MKTIPLPFARKLRITTVEEVRQLEAELQHAIDIVTNADITNANYTDNPYKSYESATQALANKYDNIADWGCQQVRNVVDVRSAFIIAQGVTAYSKDKSKTRELDFIKIWMEEHNIDEEVPQDWAREAEIEGKFLCRLRLLGEGDPTLPLVTGSSKREKTMAARIRPIYLPWLINGYEVHLASSEDYYTYKTVTYKPNKTGSQITLTQPEFVYKRFGGRVSNTRDTRSKLCNALGSIENLAKGLRDWREVNRYYQPTPVVEVATAKQVKDVQAWVEASKWNIGKLLVLAGGIYKLVGLPPGSMDSLEKEILTNAKIVSGATGVPVHFLGMPDLMSNRAVADNLMELISASTGRERRVWIGTYEELFQKVLAFANETMQAGFDVGAVGADIPDVSAAKIKELSETWLPLLVAGAISLETFLGHIPDIDKDAELERLETVAVDTRSRLTQDVNNIEEPINRVTMNAERA